MILCCGEALIDMLPVTGSNGQQAFAPLSGGAIFNTARALGRLEVPVQFLSGVSRDFFGQKLIDDLAESHVGTDLLIRSDRPTTLAFVRLTNGQAQYTFYDENSAGRMIDVAEIPRLDSAISTVYLGGISLCAEPAAAAYEQLATLHATNRVLMIDPNIRAGFIQDEAAYRARLARILQNADIVKVSDEDLDWIVPAPSTEAAKVAALQADGAKLVVLTKGSAGAEAYRNAEKIATVAVPKVTVVDTVGAGDTFNAGLLAHLQKGGKLNKSTIGELAANDVSDALEYAAKVAAITVTREGANPPRLAEL